MIKRDGIHMMLHDFNNSIEGIKNTIIKMKHNRIQGIAVESEGVTYLNTVIEDVLSLSHILHKFVNHTHEDNQEEKIIFEISSLLERFCSKADDLEISLEKPNLDIYVECVFSDMKSILENLIGNSKDALASCERKTAGKIRINVDLIPGKKRFRVEVHDNGPGIEQENMSHILEKGSTTKKGTHQGMGLYIVQDVLANYGSSLDFHSAPGQGAVFGFELDVSFLGGEHE